MENIFIGQILAAAIIGGVVTTLFAKFSKRRAKFVYTVTHSKIGTSASDPVFGIIKVTLDDYPVINLWLSTIEITNTSLSDFKDVPIQIIANDQTILLNQTLMVNTTYPNDLYFDKDFNARLIPNEENKLTEQQQKLYNSQRCYKLPIVNRGDKLTFTYLTHTAEVAPPMAQVMISAIGIRCKYKPLTNFPLDMSYTITRAITVGIILAIPLLWIVTSTVTNVLNVAIIGYALGLLTGLIGLFSSWTWDKARNLLFN